MLHNCHIPGTLLSVITVCEFETESSPLDLACLPAMQVEVADADGRTMLSAAEAPQLLAGSQATASDAAPSVAAGEPAGSLAERLGSGMHITETGARNRLC